MAAAAVRGLVHLENQDVSREAVERYIEASSAYWEDNCGALPVSVGEQELINGGYLDHAVHPDGAFSTNFSAAGRPTHRFTPDSVTQRVGYVQVASKGQVRTVDGVLTVEFTANEYTMAELTANSLQLATFNDQKRNCVVNPTGP